MSSISAGGFTHVESRRSRADATRVSKARAARCVRVALRLEATAAALLPDTEYPLGTIAVPWKGGARVVLAEIEHDVGTNLITDSTGVECSLRATVPGASASAPLLASSVIQNALASSFNVDWPLLVETDELGGVLPRGNSFLWVRFGAIGAQDWAPPVDGEPCSSIFVFDVKERVDPLE